MKIKSYELFKVPPRWLFLKIETDTGLTGWGEPIVEGRADTVMAAVDEMMQPLIGRDPMPIEDHWNSMYRSGFYRGGPILMSALSGIDQALWDIKGKFFNAPVYELMGGKARDRIKVYAWIAGDRPADVGKAALEARKNGFSAVKMNATDEMQMIDSYLKIERVLARVASLREAVGMTVDVGIDFHGRLHKAMAKVLAKELEQFHPMFIDTGERMFSRWHFKEILNSGYVDIIQPDLSHAGGITECKKIISMAEAYDVAAAPHCPLGPIALAACLQVDATCYNAFIQEQSLGIHYNKGNDLLDYVTDKSVFSYQDGYVNIPSAPGLGISINEEYVREKAKEGHNWKNPAWRHGDGSVAEW